MRNWLRPPGLTASSFPMTAWKLNSERKKSACADSGKERKRVEKSENCVKTCLLT